MTVQWSIPGADGQPIIGDTHLPAGQASGERGRRGVIVIAHGFKGYKDYGLFPRLARECAVAGFVAHRFNFSHSGMTNNVATFERPDLFQRETWSKQVFDLAALLAAVNHGDLPGGGRALPVFLLGHSRGGTVALLTTGRLTEPGVFPDQASAQRESGMFGSVRRAASHSRLAGVITLAAPSSCNPFTPEQQRELLQRGWIESPSARTGQELRVGRAFLQEQLDDPAGYDVLVHAARIDCPILVIQGDRDETVGPANAERIATAVGDRAILRSIPGGDHVFNTPNPLPEDQPSSPQLQEIIECVLAFTARITAPPKVS